MEDALAQWRKSFFQQESKGLNPCCNGRCTRTADFEGNVYFITVLILVVMEDALAQLYEHYRFSPDYES